MTKICYLNGKFMPIEQAKISPLDLGFSRGYSLIDILRTYNRKIFAFDEHYKRLKKGANFLRLKIEKKNKIKKILEKLIELNNIKEAKIKINLSGGVGKQDLEIGIPTFFVYIEKLKKIPDKLYNRGVKIITIEYKREFTKYKLGNYIEAIRNFNLLKRKNAFEILYVHKNYVYECSRSNIFCFNKNNLITPDDVLEGITRKFILKLARKKFNVFIKPLKLKDLLKSDEVFITSTIIEILPVVQIDNYKIKNGKVGYRTKILMEEWRNFINSLN